ncbi:MAG: DNA polymerase domain-containing protein, partial [Bacilli bacterium]
MYRNIYAKTERQGNSGYGTSIYLESWDDNGNPIQRRFNNIKPYLYHEATKDTAHLATAKSIFGDPLIKRSFNTQSQRKKWIEENTGKRLYENLPVTRQFLLNYYHGKERDDEFRKFKFKVWTIDIEIAVAESNKFPEASEAERPINLITVYDSSQDKYFIWYMPPDEHQEIIMPYIDEPGTADDEEDVIDMSKRHYMRFESETKLLADFFDFWANNRPDIVTGWNISAFDMPYLFNRGCKVLGIAYDVPSALSPSGNCYYVDDANTMSPILKISGISIIDYMYLYKFKFEKGKPSYALDKILDDELGLRKLDHSEYPTFYEFYTQNFSKYVEYNIMDVERVVRLDQKKRFIDLTRFICNLGLVEYEAIYHTLPYVQGAIQAQAKYHDLIFLTDTGLPESDAGFKGAYVHETRAGFYKQGGYTVDLNSLYPSLMIMINCSPETKIGKIIDIDGDKVTIRPTRGEDRITTKEKLEALVNKSCCISANNVLYYKPEIKKGIMPEFLEFLYTERRLTKNKGLALQTEINEIRTSGVDQKEKTKELTTQAELYDNAQMAYKIMLNSVYGIIGLRHYCCFDVDNAEAVTQSGQHVIKTSMNYITE